MPNALFCLNILVEIQLLTTKEFCTWHTLKQFPKKNKLFQQIDIFIDTDAFTLPHLYHRVLVVVFFCFLFFFPCSNFTDKHIHLPSKKTNSQSSHVQSLSGNNLLINQNDTLKKVKYFGHKLFISDQQDLFRYLTTACVSFNVFLSSQITPELKKGTNFLSGINTSKGLLVFVLWAKRQE